MNIFHQILHKRFFGTNKTKRKFLDHIHISVKSGNGGNGCASFSKNLKNTSYKFGVADGGNGGQGGNIYMKSTNKTQFQFDSYHFKAGNGGNGMRDSRNGKQGKHIYISVPKGTILKEVLDINYNDNNKKEYITKELYDFTTANEEFLIIEGGKGGLGNKHFKRGALTIPRFSELGEKGIKKNFILELKTIADIGLVGFPNAGKSSFLRCVSRATPKVAAYPFTTLQPSIGIVEVNDPLSSTFSVADIPGLVEGAHVNKGLGHEFLRHIERTKVLLYVLDMAGIDNRDPIDDYIALQNEIKLYSKELYQRPSLIFANKIDKKPKTTQKAINRLKKITNVKVLTGSCLKHKGIDNVIQNIFKLIE